MLPNILNKVYNQSIVGFLEQRTYTLQLLNMIKLKKDNVLNALDTLHNTGFYVHIYVNINLELYIYICVCDVLLHPLHYGFFFMRL